MWSYNSLYRVIFHTITIWSIPRIFQVSDTVNVTQLTHQIHLIMRIKQIK